MAFLDNAAETNAENLVADFRTAQKAAHDLISSGDGSILLVDVTVRVRVGELSYQEKPLVGVSPGGLAALHELAELYLGMYKVLHVDATTGNPKYRNRVFVRVSDQTAITLGVSDHEPEQNDEDIRRAKFRHPAGSKLRDGEMPDATLGYVPDQRPETD